MNKKYSELAELFRSEKTDEEILDFLLNFHKNDIADMLAGRKNGNVCIICWERRRPRMFSNILRIPGNISKN